MIDGLHFAMIKRMEDMELKFYILLIRHNYANIGGLHLERAFRVTS